MLRLPGGAHATRTAHQFSKHDGRAASPAGRKGRGSGRGSTIGLTRLLCCERSVGRRDDALAEGKAAVEPALARLDDAVGVLCPLVEGEALNADHRPVATFGSVDLLLDLVLHRRDLAWSADDLHAGGSVVDETV